jgi:hypothetical protein
MGDSMRPGVTKAEAKRPAPARPAPSRPAPMTPAPPEPTYQEYKSTEGRYRIELPGKPTEFEMPVVTKAGRIQFKMIRLSVKSKACGAPKVGCMFMFGYGDYPKKLARKAKIRKMLDGARDGMVRGTKGTLIKEKKFDVDGNPARELWVSRTAPPGFPGAKLTIRARLIVVKNRLYQLQAISGGQYDKAPEIEKILDSFKLLK